MTLLGFSTDGGERALVLPLTCRSVNRCPCCARAKKRRDRARAFLGASKVGVVAMVTFTIDPADGRVADVRNRTGKDRPRTSAMLTDPRAPIIEGSLRYQAWAWNRLGAVMRDWCRKRGYGFAAFRGVELMASGYAHVHALIRVPDATEFMALRAKLRGDEAQRERLARTRPSARKAGAAVVAGFGMVVDVQRARSRGDVARYVTKMGDAGVTAGPAARDASAYATKGVTAPMPRYTRRSSYSREWAPDWTKPTPIAGFDWRLARASADVVRDALVRSDFVVDDPARYRVPVVPERAGG